MRRARDAELIESFGLTPAQIGELTERQISEYYFHPREKDTRQIKHPEAQSGPQTCEQHVAAYLAVAAATNARNPGTFPPEAVAAKVEQIKAHWAKKGAGNGG